MSLKENKERRTKYVVAQVGFEPTSQPYEGHKETAPLPRNIGQFYNLPRLRISQLACPRFGDSLILS